MMDLFSQMFVLDEGAALGRYITQYRNSFFDPYGYMGYEYRLKEGAEKLIYSKIKPLVLRYGNDFTSLPSLVKIHHEVDLPKEARVMYDSLEKDLIAQYGEEVITANSASAIVQKLNQIANGGAYLEDGSVVHVHDEKTEELKEIIEELQGDPCLVVYEYKHDLQRLQEAFPNTPYIGGGVSNAEGLRLEHEWNEGNLPLLFGQPASIAHGLNLQESGSTIVFYSMIWNLEDYEQVIHRIWRKGQKNKVVVHHIVAQYTVDELILRRITNKDFTQQNLLEALNTKFKYEEKTMKPAVNFIISDINMPTYNDKSPTPQSDWVIGLLNMIDKWDNLTKNYLLTLMDKSDTATPQTLYSDTKNAVFELLDITLNDDNMFEVGNVKLMKEMDTTHRSMKEKDLKPRYTLEKEVKAEVLDVTLNESTTTKEDEKMKEETAKLSDNDAPAKKKVLTKKEAIKKINAKKKSKKVVVKKTSAKKIASKKGVLSSTEDRDVFTGTNKILFKLLQRKKGVSIEEAIDKTGKSLGAVRFAVHAIKKKGFKVERIANGVFRVEG